MKLCSCCGYMGDDYIDNGMGHDQCPNCGSFSRHRLMCLTVEKLSITPSSSILHFAPENSVSQKLLQYHPALYIGADKLKNEGRKTGITIQEMTAENIPYNDNVFSGVIASHVMEHVDDDTQCIKSFRRVLQPKGWVMLLIPIFSHLLDGHDSTDFGQADHKRLYQPSELMEEMTLNGFDCKSLYSFNELSSGYAIRQYGIHQHHLKFKDADMLCFKT